MPLVNGKFQYWWNWSARDPKTGKLRTFFTNGFGHVINREQLYAHIKNAFRFVDLSNFSCELTDKMPPNKRDTVPLEYRMSEWERWSNRQITKDKHDAGIFAKAGLADRPVAQARRSILYGKASY